MFISCFFAFAVFAAQAVALTHSAAAQTNAAANMTLQAEIEKKSPSLVTVLQALDAGADPDHKAGEVPLLIVAATMGHAEIVSVLVTAGADPDARWKRASCVSQTVGRAVPHLVAQNNFSPTLYYTWGTALNVLRHFADAVNQTANATTYDWNAEGVSPNCGSTNPAIDFLASRFRNDDASLPEESDDEKYLAIMGMADIMLANKASCANAGIPKHVTCAGSAAAAEVCSPGQGVMYGGNLGGWTYDGIWCVDCPVGQGVLANNTCGVCPAGQVVQGGICVAIATCDSPAVLNAETNQCDCPSGYSGAGGVCNADVTVSFSPPVNGTLSAASGGDSIQNGGTVVHGATVTFTATPASGYEVSIWTGGCAGAVGVSCEAVATVNVSAGVEFFEASAASCGRLSPAKGYDDSGAGACVAPSAASCGRLSPVKGYDDSGAGACVAASAASCRRLSPAQGYDDSGAGACEVCSSGEGVLADGTCGVCLAGQVILGGACTAPSAASCRRLSPAQGYDDSGAGACEVCSSGEGVLADGTCGVCLAGQFILGGACTAPSAASCGRLSPVKGYDDSGAGACVAPSAASCGRLSPTKGYDDSGAGACVAPGAASCGRLSPAQAYDSAAKACVVRTEEYARLKCTAAGRSWDDSGQCQIRWINDAGSSSGHWCGYNDYSAICADIVGPDYDFPNKPKDGPPSYYVYNCDVDGSTGMIPATINTIGATACACPAGQGVDEKGVVCGAASAESCRRLSPAQVYDSGACVLRTEEYAREKCTAAGWRWSSGSGLCRIRWNNYADGSDGYWCGYSAFSPKCADIVGPDYDFPNRPGDGSVLTTYVYNCDVDGSTGMIPATINTIGATACACPAGQGVDENLVCGAASAESCRRLSPAQGYDDSGAGACEVCPSGQGVLADGTCGVCPTGQVVQGGICVAIATCDSPAVLNAETNQCDCPSGYSGAGGVCNADVTVSFSPPVNGTLSAASGGDSIQNGGTVVHGATVTFTATPASGYEVSIWTGGCAGAVGVSCEAVATVNVSAGVEFFEASAASCRRLSPAKGYDDSGAGACEVCSSGEGVLADGTCGVCPVGQGVLADNTCGACPVGEGVLADSACGVCPVGQVVQGGVCVAIATCDSPAVLNAETNQCDCPSGYSGAGGVCNADVTVSFSPPANGTLSAASGGDSIQNGGTVAHGATVTFTAAPASGYEVSIWTGGCAGAVGVSCEAVATANVSAGVEFFEASAASCGRLIPAKGYDDSGAGACVAPSAASCGRLSPVKGYDDSGAGACVAASAESCRRLSPAQGYDDSGAGACEVCPFGYDAEAEACVAHEDVLLAEIRKDSPSLVTVLQALEAGASPDHKAGEVPLLIVAATMGHAEIVSVLVTAGADPDARWKRASCVSQTVGRAVPHLVAQNNYRPTLYYTWGTALNVLRHFADAVSLNVTATYDWNAEGVSPNCGSTNPAIDFLASRFRNDDASLPEESDDEKYLAIMGMADIMLANKASCANAGIPKHVTCAGSAAAAEVCSPGQGVMYGGNLGGWTYDGIWCVDCPVGQGVLANNTCGVCPAGQVVQGGICVAIATCDSPAVLNAETNQCDCPSGYSGAGGVCNADVTVSFSPPVNGTLSAASGGDSIQNGGTVVHGATVTFTATPASGYEVSIWTGGCAGAVGVSCEAVATVNVSAGVEFFEASAASCGRLSPAKGYDDSGAAMCVEPSAASCRRLSPAQGYDDSGAGACEVCPSGEGVLADGTCGVCPTGQVILDGACTAPSAASCGRLIPAKGYDDSGAGACVAPSAASCGRLSPVKGYDDSGAGACVAPGAASCGRLSPAQAYDSAAKACVVRTEEYARLKCTAAGRSWDDSGRCQIRWINKAGSSSGDSSSGDWCGYSVIAPKCADIVGPDYDFPNRPDDGSALTTYVYNCDVDGSTGMIPATINTIGATACACPAGQGVDENGVCVAASAESCGRLSPVKGYDDSGAGACVAPSAASCVRLSPARAYDEAARACVVRTEEELREKCTAAGWTWMNGQCSIRWNNHAEGRIGRIGQWCSYRYSVKCADIVGPDYDFPSAAGVRQPTYVYNCDVDGSTGMIPATINTIGATACACPAAGQGVDENGVCVAASAESCRRLSPAQGYDDSGAGACEVCSSGEGVLADGTCGVCLAGQVILGGACTAPSAESCGRLSPTKGYDDSGAGACVAPSAASCGRLSPVKGYDDSGAGACVAPSAASCESVTPAMVYDAATGECAFLFPAVCASPSVRNKGTNLCDCQAPNIGENGAAAPGFCHGELALITVAQDGDVALVARLIAAGATVDVTNNIGYTPLHWAARGGHLPVVAELIAAGATVDVTDNSGYTPLHWAARGGHIPVVAELIAAKASVNVINSSDQTALYLAERGVYRHGYNSASIPLLIEAGGHWGTECASPNVVNPAGPTPPCAAVAVCTSPSVRNKGTNLCDCPVENEGTGGGNAGTDGEEAPGKCAAAGETSCGELTPAQFYDAAARKCVAVADCLAPATLDADKNLCDCSLPNIGTDDASAPGDCAVPAPDETSCGGLSPPQFYDAAAGECVAFAVCAAPAVLDEDENLCDCPSPNIGTDGLAAPGFCRSEYALHTAVRDGDLDFVGRFLAVVPRAEVSVFVNARNNGGWTPLHQAARFNRPAIALTLLAAGASVNVSNSNHTPLSYADSYKNAGLYPHLIAAGGHWGTACAAGEFVNPAGPNPSCVAVSAASCGEASSAKGYDPAADACVAPSPASCGELSPAKGYHLVADACVAPSAASCGRLSPVKVYDDSGAGACVAPGAASCGRLSPTKGYDPAARACVAPSAASCGRLSPVKGYDDSGAGACVAPSAASCGRLSPVKGYDDSGAGACTAPSAASCGILIPAKGYDDSGAGACVAPSVASCDRLSPAQAYDGSGCFAPSAASCGRLSPAKGYEVIGGAATCVAASAASCWRLSPVRVYDEEAKACVLRTAEEAKEKCTTAGWDWLDGDFFNSFTHYCNIRWENRSALRKSFWCIYTASSSDFPNLDEPNCADIVGPDYDFPRKIDDRAYYVYNCDVDGITGLIPATINTIGATACACPNGQGVDEGGVCGVAASVESCGRLTPAQAYDSTAGACVVRTEEYARLKCTAAGRQWGRGSCRILWNNYADGSDGYWCSYSAFSPKCADVVGPDYDFPKKSGDVFAETTYVYNCDVDGSTGMIPATINTIGATACACPAGQVVQGGVCVAIATCDSPAVLNAETNQCDCPSGYSGAGGVCNADVTVSFSPPVNGTLSAASGGNSIQNGGTVVHGATVTFTAAPASGYEVSIWTGGCAGAVGVSCEAVATADVSAGVEFFEASAASCGRLSPAQGYDDSGAGACVAPSAASCGRLYPTKGYDDSGAGACVAPSAASCESVTPAKVYDAAAGECAFLFPAVCASPSVRNARTNLCDCPAPNIGENGAAAPGFCHGEYALNIAAQIGDVALVVRLIAAGALVDGRDAANYTPLHRAALRSHIPVIAELIAAKASLNVTTNTQGETPLVLAKRGYGYNRASIPLLIEAGGHWGTECASPNVVNPAGPTPPCAAAAACTSPSVRNKGTNLCDCPVLNAGTGGENAGTDGEEAPGKCAAAGETSCGELTPAQFYDAAARKCVAVADCLAPATLDADKNLCDCSLPNIGTDDASAPGDCAVPAPDETICEGLSPPQFYDAAAGECVAFAVCAAPAVLDEDENLCDCPSPNIGTDGLAAPGFCRSEYALHTAVRDGDLDFVGRFLAVVPRAEVSVFVNARNNGGWTPLHQAARFNRPAIALTLLAAGASVNASNNDHTPLSYANNYSNAGLYPHLIAAGGHWGTACAAGEFVNPAGPAPSCVAVSAASCGEASSAKGYDPAADACVAPSPASCGELSPAKGYHLVADACVAPSAASCRRLSPAKGYDDSGAGACVAPGAASCGRLSPAQAYDSAAKACVVRTEEEAGAKCTAAGWTWESSQCSIKWNNHAESRIDRRNGQWCGYNGHLGLKCGDIVGPDYDFPNKPEDGSSPRYVFNCDVDGSTGMIPATINTIGATACACPAGQGVDEKGVVCVAASAESCGRLSPVKGYDDSGAGACVAPSAASCVRLSPEQFYDDSGAGECVAFAVCDLSAVLNKGTNECDCRSGYSGAGGVCNADVTVSFSPPVNGTLSAASGGNSIQNGGTVVHGATVTFTAEPASGWYVEGWNNGGCAGDVGSAASPGEEKECDLSAESNLLVTVTFAVAREVVFGEGLFASLTADGASVASGDTFADGTTIGFLATPPENHEIAGWTNDGAEVCAGQNPCILEAADDLDVRAEFASLLRTIVYAALPGDGSGGTLIASVPFGGAVLRGETATFTATPAAGWYVEGWNNGGCAGDVGSAASPGEEKECDLSAESNLLVTVTFAVAREVVFGEGLFASLTADGASVASGDTFADGTTIGFLATPPENREIARWTNDGAEVCVGQNPCVLEADGDLDVRAEFKLVSRLIEYSEVPGGNSGGTLTASVPSGGTTLHGATVTFTATPSAGWYVEGWNNGGCAGDVGSAASPGEEKECDLSAESNLLVTVTFAVAREVVFGEGLFASLTADGASVASGDTFADGTTIGFLATPPENHEIAGWTNDGAEVCAGQNPCVLEADGDLDVRAEFQLVSRLIGYSEVPGDNSGGTLIASVPSGGTTLHGATVTFTATPSAGWYVEGWNNGGCAGDVGSAASPGEEKECDLSAEADLLVTVTFAVAREVVFGEGLFASLTADGASVASGDTFADGTTIGFLATPPENREIARWTNDGAEVCAGQNPCVLEADDDLDVRAEFKLVSRLIGYSEVPGGNSGGTLTASVPSGGTTLHGATVTFTAIPASGWYVEGWNNGGCAGDVGSAASPGEEKECDLSAEADLLVTVTFAVAREVVFGEGLFASLTADGASVASGDTFADGTTIGFLATPPENHEIAGWTNDGAEVCVGQNPCILEADGDLDVRAEFQLVSRLIGYSEVPGGNSGGTLIASVPSGGTTLHGATVTFTATPAAGWYVEGWNNGGCAGDVGSAASPGEEKECDLSAEADLLVTVTFAVAREVVFGEGLFASLTADGASVTSGDTFADGTTIGFLATPPENRELAGWTNNGAEVCAGQNPCVLEAKVDLDVRAVFKPVSRTIGYSALPGDNSGGTLTGSVPSGGTAPHGATVTFTATPAAGWYVGGWNNDGCAGDVGSVASPGEEKECALPAEAGLLVTVTFAVVPGVEACRKLTPSQFYDAAEKECVPFVDCHATALPNADNSGCECPAGAFAHGDPATAACHAGHAPIPHGLDEWLSAIQGLDLTLVAHFIFGHQQDPDDDDEVYHLHMAAKKGNLTLATYLIAGGADINRIDGDDDAPLHPAVRNDRAELITLLLQRGAKVDTQGNGGDTPLHLAARRIDAPENIGLISLLLDQDAAPNLPNNDGWRPLDLAYHGGNDETWQARRGIMAALIAGGATWRDECRGGAIPNALYGGAAAVATYPRCACPRHISERDSFGACECPADSHAQVNGRCLPKDSAAAEDEIAKMKKELTRLRALLDELNKQLSLAAEADTPREEVEKIAAQAESAAQGIRRHRDNFVSLGLDEEAGAPPPPVEMSDTEAECRMLRGDVEIDSATGVRVCSGIDKNDTFCLVDSDGPLPCHGLFRHVRICNDKYNRPALNPFFCGPQCAGTEKATGKECVAAP